MRVYVASSWRNAHQQEVVLQLRRNGFEVYDFKNPAPGDNGFHWSEIDEDWASWDVEAFKAGLRHDIAEAGFKKDMAALDDADAVVLVMPCGRSAHLELGYAVGQGKRTCILTDIQEPELMYKMVDDLFYSLEEVLEWLGKLANGKRGKEAEGRASDV